MSPRFLLVRELKGGFAPTSDGWYYTLSIDGTTFNYDVYGGPHISKQDAEKFGRRFADQIDAKFGQGYVRTSA